MPISALRPNPNNPRTHSKKQIRKITNCIRKFGFLVPVLVNAANQILAGHARFEAAKVDGVKEVPVIRIDWLSPEQVRALLIADNRLAEEAGWDNERLSVEL